MLLFIAKKELFANVSDYYITLVVLRVNSVDARSRAMDTKSRRHNTKFSSVSLFIGLFTLKIKDESHFKLLCFCFTNTVILASKKLNPMHKLCFFSKPIFQIFIFSLTFSHRPYTRSRHATLKIVCKKYAQFNAFSYGICKCPRSLF